MKKKYQTKPKKMAISAPKKSDYENDFYKWSFKQAKLLKKGEFEKVDVQNLIEEIESLGRSEKRTLLSNLEVMFMHMLKKDYQSEKKSKSWDHSIKNGRDKAKSVLKDNPSLKPKLEQIAKEAYKYARRDAAQETKLPEKNFPKECPWKITDILK